MRENFKIENISIKSIHFGGMVGDYENIFHQKILSTLSIVQSVEGSYDISINGSKTYSTGKGGVFIAPRGAVQKITHRNGANGNMYAQWVFIDAIINGTYVSKEGSGFGLKSLNERIKMFYGDKYGLTFGDCSKGAVIYIKIPRVNA